MALVTHPNDFAAVANCIEERICEMFLATVPKWVLVAKLPSQGDTRHCVSALGTTGGTLGIGGRCGGCVGCGVAMAKEEVEAKVAEGICYAMNMCPSMELMFLIPLHNFITNKWNWLRCNGGMQFINMCDSANSETVCLWW